MWITKFLAKIMDKIRYRFHLYNLEDECVLWVKNNIGSEYVPEFIDKYHKLQRGIPIGNMITTISFLNIIDNVKLDLYNRQKGWSV